MLLSMLLNVLVRGRIAAHRFNKRGNKMFPISRIILLVGSSDGESCIPHGLNLHVDVGVGVGVVVTVVEGLNRVRIGCLNLMLLLLWKLLLLLLSALRSSGGCPRWLQTR
ncbi:MAG: hypothetical protein J3R72DRAFT_457970 [Linnemannia gamsii]|nr:MAG: hypothetical protein J3R72DRAFT_457970 [Linnemannia gamsii]